MPVVFVEPDLLDFIPGSAGAATQVQSSATTIFVDDALTFDSLWPKSASARRGRPSISLTYDPVLSRVRITAIGVNPATAVAVDRSTNLVSWTPVRGGEAATVNVDTMTLDDYEFAPNVANYYRLRPANPPAGLYLPGLPGRYAYTPDASVLDIVGDIEIRADLTLANWNTGSFRSLVSKYRASGNQKSYGLGINSAGFLSLFWSNNGTADLNMDSTVRPSTVAASGRLAVRATLDVNNGAAGKTAVFYTAPTIDGPWTQLGATVTTATTTSIFASTAQVEVGSDESGTADLVAGTVHAVEVRDGIGGTLVANPNFATQASLATNFIDGAGRSWSMPEDALIYGATLAVSDSITPVQTSMWLKSVARPFLNLTVSLLGDSHVFDRPERGAAFEVVGRSLPVAVSDVRGSRRYTIKVRTDTFDQGDALDLLLASGDILFLQGMADSVVTRTGVYVFAGPTTAEYPIAPDPMRFTSIAVTECAAPGPDVVGATSSWQTVINTYATWADVIAANATWADLLELVGNPTEVIVP